MRVFGGRQNYLEADEQEALEQLLLWKEQTRADNEQRQRDADALKG